MARSLQFAHLYAAVLHLLPITCGTVALYDWVEGRFCQSYEVQHESLSSKEKALAVNRKLLVASEIYCSYVCLYYNYQIYEFLLLGSFSHWSDSWGISLPGTYRIGNIIYIDYKFSSVYRCAGSEWGFHGIDLLLGVKYSNTACILDILCIYSRDINNNDAVF